MKKLRDIKSWFGQKPCCGECCKKKVPKKAEAYGGSTWGDECNDAMKYYLDVSNANPSDEIKTLEEYRKVFREALDEIERTCGVKFIEVKDKDDAFIFIKFGRTRGSVLAWSTVGGRCGGTGQQLYGNKWNWSKDYLISTILHEVAHLLSLSHSPCVNSDGEPNIMCWQAQKNMTKYDKVTAKKLRDIYGPPNKEPKPEPNPQPKPKPDDDEIEWPFELQPGETFWNVVRIGMNMLWYFFIYKVFLK